MDLRAPYPDEESLYRALGLAWIPPELREGAGELDAASDGKLPRLLEERDLKGLLHCHSNYSDGTVTIAEWAEAAKHAGYEWIGITDHSQSAAYAGGLRADDVAKHDRHLPGLGAEYPYAIDMERVLAKAAEQGIAVEVNADPHRLDLDWRQVRRARELGVTISIGADAHSVAGMANVPVGVGIARKGWLEARDVLNTRDADAFLGYARKRRTA